MIDITNEEIDELNDDGKLYRRWMNKKVNATKEGLECELSYEEYCYLVKQAGLKSSQLGFKGEKYVLARYNDSGNYSIGNCRFITQYENTKERKLSEKSIIASRNNIQKFNNENKKNKKETSLKIKESLQKSEKNQNRLLKMQSKIMPQKEVLEKELTTLKPIIQLAKEYNISDNGYRKWLKKYNLPYLRQDIIKFAKQKQSGM